MVACKRQPAADLEESRWNKPWDLGITFGRHALNPQHLEDKVFLQEPWNDREIEVQGDDSITAVTRVQILVQIAEKGTTTAEMGV